MALLRIPEADRAALRKLVSLPPQSSERLLAALTQAPPLIDPGDLAETIAPQVDFVSLADLKDLTDLLMSLYSVRESHEVSVDGFVQDLCEAMQTPSPQGGAVLSSVECEDLKLRLTQLLQIPSLELASRAWDVRADQPNTFESASVLTDLRPVFGRGQQGVMEGAVVVNLLKLTYWSNGRLRDIFIACDADDIRALREVLDRAEVRSKALRGLLASSNILDLGG